MLCAHNYEPKGCVRFWGASAKHGRYHNIGAFQTIPWSPHLLDNMVLSGGNKLCYNSFTSVNYYEE